MKVAGIKMSDPWASRVLRGHGVEWSRVEGAPVETEVLMEQVSFEHHGPGKNYRPLLHLTGELRAIRPHDLLPYGVEEVTFRSGMGPTVDAFYEFDDAQLSELVSKGYFTEGFEPPATMAGIPWDLPTAIDALILAPEGEEDTPVVFVTVHGQTELALNAENSGYDLAEYFPNNLAADAQLEREVVDTGLEVPTSSGEMETLFSADEFTAPVANHYGEVHRGDFPVVRASIFEDLMAEFKEATAIPTIPAVVETDEFEQQYEEEGEISDPIATLYRERIVEGRTQTPDLPAAEQPIETLYQERIVPGVTEAMELPVLDEPADRYEDLSAETQESLSEDSGSLDLGPEEEDELDVVPIATAPVLEPVWEPETEAEKPVPPVTRATTATAPTSKPGVLQRRVQRALEHERAMDLDHGNSDEPELG